MKLFPMLLAAFSLAAVSCERHDFEGEHGTKQLHTHGQGHGEAHGDDHSGGDRHAADEPH